MPPLLSVGGASITRRARGWCRNRIYGREGNCASNRNRRSGMRSVVPKACLSVGLLLAGMVGGFHLRAQAPAAAVQGPTAQAPPDTAALRANYDRWRTEFKTWNRW